MNRDAEKHLDAAKGFLARGDQFYRKAAEEIIAAQKADPTLTNTEIGEWFDRGKDWVRTIVRWSTTDEDHSTPFTHDTPRRMAGHVRTVLRDAPMEEIEKVVAELPPERRQKLRSAAFDPDYAELEREQADRRAVRKEHSEDPDAVHARMLRLALSKADDALREATGVARDAEFESKHVSPLLARVQVTAELLDMLRLVISGTEGVDWDAELARLSEAAAATEGDLA